MISLDLIAASSRISKLDSLAKLAFAFIPLFVSIYFGSVVVSSVLFIVMASATLISGGLRLRTYLKLLMIPFFFVLTAVLAIMIDPAGGISASSAKKGMELFIRSFGAVAALYYFSLNTPMSSILNMFRRLRAPVLLIDLMELVYRYIFILLDEAHKVRQAQEARLGYAGYRRSLASLGLLVTSVFQSSFRRLDRASLLLEARGAYGSVNFAAEEESPGGALVPAALGLSVLLIAVGYIERMAR